jgi:hypothetical protein
MRTQKSVLLTLSSGGMTLSAFYACTSFVFACISQKPIPLIEAGMILFMAILITAIHNRRGWRRIYVIGLHILGLLFAFLRLCHNYYGFESSFWSFHWVQEFFMLERPAASWFVLVLILLCIWILWFCGIRLFTRPTDQTTISDRFDSGLGFLVLLLLIKLVIAVKGVSIPVEHSATRPIISFMILGLFSMGIVRNSSPSQIGGITYFKGAGIAMTFTFIILMLGGGLFILFLPEFQNLAETSADLLKTVTKPLEQILIALSRFFLESGIRRKLGEEPTGELLPAINRSGGEFGILHYLFIGITITILLAMAGFIIYRLLKWLLSKIKWFFSETVEEKDKKGIWELLLSFIHAAKQLFSSLRGRILSNRDGSYTAKKFYQNLLRWGRFSGLNHAVFETPKEYAIRLGHRFPQIEKEIRLIVHLHDEAIYGCISPDSHQISRARLALRRIRNPLLWFARIKSLCFHNRF